MVLIISVYPRALYLKRIICEFYFMYEFRVEILRVVIGLPAQRFAIFRFSWPKCSNETREEKSTFVEEGAISRIVTNFSLIIPFMVNMSVVFKRLYCYLQVMIGI